MSAEFKEFPKIARLNREVIITEKIDGTNAAVWISEDGTGILAQSRTKIITISDDNFGFAKWVQDNREELLKLGPGTHFGEWWGSGIQRGYGLPKGEKRFSLFNTSRWSDEAIRPSCCHVVPVIVRGMHIDLLVNEAMALLRSHGSVAAPGFMKPEGIVVFHTASNIMFKVTLEKDEEWKGKSK